MALSVVQEGQVDLRDNLAEPIANDLVLHKIRQYTLHGWPNKVPEDC